MNRNVLTLIDGLEQAAERLEIAENDTKDANTALDIHSALEIIEEVTSDLQEVADLIELLYKGKRQFPL